MLQFDGGQVTNEGRWLVAGGGEKWTIPERPFLCRPNRFAPDPLICKCGFVIETRKS
jgi:hypothetical protein